MSATDLEKQPDLDTEIEGLKAKIKEIEDKLRQLRANNSNMRPISPVATGDIDINIINDLQDRVEKLENQQEKTNDKLENHDERIEKLEQDNDVNKDKISSNSQDISELKDQLPEKVDCDVFDQEINYIKELLKQLMEGKDADIKMPPPPAASSGMSTKDQNKMKEMMAKIPELEKMLQDVLERLKRAENNIENHDKNIKDHDKEIEKIWDELAKKANQSDLKDLFDRLNNLERDLEKVISALNSMSNSKAPVLSTTPTNSDKRFDALEKKVEEIRNDINNGLRDLGKQLNEVNERCSNSEKEIEKLKNDLLKLMKKVNDLELKIDTILKMGNNNNTQVSGVDPEKLDELKKILNDLRNDYRNFKNEVFDKFNQTDEELSKKADKEDLEKLKKMLMDKLKDLENALNKTKSDLKRALKILNEKVSLIPS